MKERSEMILAIRSELVGPSTFYEDPKIVEFQDRVFTDTESFRKGQLAWRPSPNGSPQEVLYFERESPYRKYGAGVLHPASLDCLAADEAAAQMTDTVGADIGVDSPNTDDSADAAEVQTETDDATERNYSESSDDFEVSSADYRFPSTLGISVCIQLDEDSSELVINLPQSRRLFWQGKNDLPVELNGRYEQCKRKWKDTNEKEYQADIWRRVPALLPTTEIKIAKTEFVTKKVIKRLVAMPSGSPIALEVQVYPRRLPEGKNGWLTTIVLSNRSNSTNHNEAILYQTYFEVSVKKGELKRYPESRGKFEKLDPEEKSLLLLYQEDSTWGIGHGCAAGWHAELGNKPEKVFADVMPAVELPSMTPDVEVDGVPIRLSMRELADLSDDGSGLAWESINNLVGGYASWIEDQRHRVSALPYELQTIALENLKYCDECLERIKSGIYKLKSDQQARQAFRLTNLSMLLQQIATKQLDRRSLELQGQFVRPGGNHQSPWSIYNAGQEDLTRLGTWRAFQIAFLIMTLPEVSEGRLPDREIVDLIWFPTGGGKTEAYLGVMSFYMFHQRLLMQDGDELPARDGTNVLMRYTLRMLTTQQFQRAASLICAMEYIRRNSESIKVNQIPGRRFSLGLWIGGEGSPNKIKGARTELGKYRRESDPIHGNPLVLTECPWCRAEIGRFDGSKPRARPPITDTDWNTRRTVGITDDRESGPLLHCSANTCEFGQELPETWLPVEVIDERIYNHPPSLVISTADKLAIIAYRPQAGALFGRQFNGAKVYQVALPPGVIIQDELHLISGPLGTMYALYEGIIERLCSIEIGGSVIKPKLIASTATIRGAQEQVLSLYDRSETRLFPSPALSMGDSFFGKYARESSGSLSKGRLYLGIHANGYGSILTAQVRTFAAALFRPWMFDEAKRDPWWTLLAFYNSIRELGGARTLFDSDIRSRLKFLFNRENFPFDKRRNLQIVEELTSRLSQAGIVQMMDRLSTSYEKSKPNKRIDACLASNIIEVGVDIDRLSLMGVVGQPKTTASYIQVTGRVGRRWWERPGLIMTLYSPAKSRDRSHFEQFHSYHRRLYEQVEPTTATPFAVSAIERGLAGALLFWSRQHCNAGVENSSAYRSFIDIGYELLRDRCKSIQIREDQARSLDALERMRDMLISKWSSNPQHWEEFPQKPEGEYLMLWPGQYRTPLQEKLGVEVPSSMRQVDRSAELSITQGYVAQSQATVQPGNQVPSGVNPNTTTKL